MTTKIVEVGFTGTQVGMTSTQREKVHQLITTLAIAGPLECHHGDCIGADEDFDIICDSLGKKIKRVIIHPPTIDYKRAACHVRDGRTVQTTVQPTKPYLEA